MWTIISLLASGIALAVVAFVTWPLPAYLRKKAENIATREDLKDLVTQMEAVTEATKRIEAEISDKVWSRQRRWELRRDTILAAMDIVADAQIALTSLIFAIELIKLRIGDQEVASQKMREANDNLTLAITNLLKATYKVQLICTPDVQRGIRVVQVLILDAHQTLGRDPGDPIRAKEIGEATEQFQSAMRKELEIDKEPLPTILRSSES